MTLVLIILIILILGGGGWGYYGGGLSGPFPGLLGLSFSWLGSYGRVPEFDFDLGMGSYGRIA
jgi:hypothetical protein